MTNRPVTYCFFLFGVNVTGQITWRVAGGRDGGKTLREDEYLTRLWDFFKEKKSRQC